MRSSSFLQNTPFLQILIPFVLGIIGAQYLPRKHEIFFLLGFSILSAISFLLKIKHGSTTFRSSLVFLVLVFCGYELSTLKTTYVEFPQVEMVYNGIVLSSPERKNKTDQVDCYITHLHTDSTQKKFRQKVRLYIDTNNLSGEVHIGDSIQFTSSLQAVRNRGNPEEFNYAAHLLTHGIRYTGYVADGKLHWGNNSGKFRLLHWADRSRQWLLAQFRNYGIQGNQLAILAALSTGEKGLLNDELKFDYSAAGGMHVLAVSGLHVGILYLFLNWLLAFRLSPAGYRLFRLLIITGCLWFYAFLTGLTPSVMRASFMFTFFLIGKSTFRKGSGYNYLFASALILLVINPLELFKIGFQFSYLAVLGIFFFQPKLESILPMIRRPIIRLPWQLITVSISAQLFTFPLALYYFHQYPIYFLLTNFVLLPTVWIVLISTLLFALSSPLPAVAKLLAGLINLLLMGNNYCISWISHLPGACIFNIPFSSIQFFATFLSIIGLTYIIRRRQYQLIPHIILAAILLVQVPAMVQAMYRNKHNELIIYNTHPENIISLIDNNKHYLITRDIDSLSGCKSLKYLNSFWVEKGIIKNTFWVSGMENKGTFHDESGFYIQQDKQHLHIEYKHFTLHTLTRHDRKKHPLWSRKPNTYLIINRASGYPESYSPMLKHQSFLVLTSSLSKKQVHAWKDYALHNQLKYHLLTNGALRIPLSTPKTTVQNQDRTKLLADSEK